MTDFTLTAMFLTWLPAIWFSVFSSLRSLDLYRPICCDTSPPNLVAGALYLILPVGTLAASWWLSQKALKKGRARTALAVSGLSCLVGATASALLFMSIQI